MFARIGNVFLIVALLMATGGHWAMLQTVAWTTMIAADMGKDSFKTAVSKTFDGKHPCCLCKMIDCCKKSEKKSEFAIKMPRLEFPPTAAPFDFVAPQSFNALIAGNVFADCLPQQPPTPPPRSFPA